MAAERALLARHVTSGFPATIARPAAIYGPYNNIYDMEAAMFRRLFERRPVLLPYHGLVVGSYGHVDDLCRALLVMAAPDRQNHSSVWAWPARRSYTGESPRTRVILPGSSIP